MKSHLMRQENGSNMSTGAASSAGNVGNLTVPPPGLPGPTVSNAEAAAQLMNLGLYPGFQLNVINPAASPYGLPQFYVSDIIINLFLFEINYLRFRCQTCLRHPRRARISTKGAAGINNRRHYSEILVSDEFNE